ncbi:30S ribosomal protein S16 [Nesterenkonia sp. MY13]|uniref:Small ribosomal subunit protein bS16 n=1 Tax=Nesterenkonia sedimenti TaxID=1463632 RepID=A0A7X8YDZ7_9MICC|nr:30S ribosomal protein S16 [Nesterenkonia sedimenti]NLS10074.1 30S ribosomal protein S16 [Nesterenkonia sedimenti]
MAVKIRLKRMGKKFAPQYRVVVADSRAKRDGKNIEEIGKYHPTEEPSFIEINSERAQYWLSVGAQPTEQVKALLNVTGDWQKFKGIDGAEGTLKTKAPKEEFTAPSKGSVIVEKSEEPAKEEAPAEEAAAEAPAEEAAEENTEA